MAQLGNLIVNGAARVLNNIYGNLVGTVNGFTIGKSVPSNAVFTDTDTKVTAVGNHYTPTGTTTKSASGGTATNATGSGNAQQVVTGVTVDAAGHVTAVTSKGIYSTDTDTNTWRSISDSVSSTASDVSASSKAVKTAYDLAASKTSNTGTITGITMNGASKGTSGVVDLGTVITAHQDISGKVSGPSSATNNAVAIFDGTGGKTIKNSGYTIGKSVPSDAVFTDTNTHRPIQVNGTEVLGNNTTALNLKAGSNVTVTNSSGTVTIAATDTNTWRPVSDSVSSTSSSDAASSKAVKTAYDLAASKTSNTGTVTKVTAGSGLSGGDITTSGTISHASTVTAGTVGTSSGTNGATLAVPYVTYNGTGHITATGTHTHTVNGLIAYCTTAANYTTKVATCPGYVLTANRYVVVRMTTANTSAGALTLAINGTLAKPIYINGTAASSSNYTLPAGDYLVYYDGTGYHFWTNGAFLADQLYESDAYAITSNDINDIFS